MSYDPTFLSELFDTMNPQTRNIISVLSPFINGGGQSIASRNNINTDIVNTDQHIVIYAELPGVEKENISVDFYNNKITLVVDKNRPYENPTMSEIKYGHHERTITLPICVTQRETVTVVYKNGVLKITINKQIEEENKFSVSINE